MDEKTQKILSLLIDVAIVSAIVFAFVKGGLYRMSIGKTAYGILDIFVGTAFGIWAFLRLRR